MANGGGTSDITQVAGALTAVVGVFTALAVTGVLGQAQRNHGLLLVVGLGVVLLGAVLWLLATLRAGTQTGLKHLALLSLAAGLILGILAIWFTQKDSERPSVTSTFDPHTSVFTVTASAHGMRTDSRLVIVVSGFRGTPDRPSPQQDPPTLYYAVVGPNSDGDVSHTAEIPVPTKYTLVGVKAWTGKEPNACTTREVEGASETPQHDRVGCLLLQVRDKGAGPNQ